MNYKCIILTRFNIRFDERCIRTLDMDWLNYRLDLFKQFCLPSVQNQLCKNFQWIILMDEDTPMPFRKQMEQCIAGCQEAELLYLPYNTNINTQFKAIAQKYSSNIDVLVSVRLDSDDLLSNNFIRDMLASLPSSITHRIAIIFPNGLQLYPERHIGLHITNPKNHFRALAEPAKSARGELDFSQIDFQDMTVLLGGQAPYWAEIIHSNNLFNDFEWKFHPRSMHTPLDSFAIDLQDYCHKKANQYFIFLNYFRYRLRQIQHVFSFRQPTIRKRIF